MANIDKIRAKIKQYTEKGNERAEFQRKVLQLGDNRFRIIGDVKYVYEHWFISADGISLHSICSKDENGKGHCTVCDKYEEARTLLASEDSSLSPEEMKNAKIITGDEIADGAKFAGTWRAREYAYMNVIDRDDNWCRDNKHTKILCKSLAQSGVSSAKGGIFNEIVDIIDENGDYEANAYDIRIKKSGRNMDTQYRGYIDKECELTPEEKAYKVYDLDSITPATSEEQLNRWLTVGVKQKEEDKTVTKEKTNIVSTVKPKVEVKETVRPAIVTKVETEVKPAVALKMKAKVEPKPEPPVVVEPIIDEELAECPSCGKEIPVTSNKCKYCLIEFESDLDIDL